MANPETKRFYMALVVWTCAFIAGAALARAGLVGTTLEALAFSFILGLLAIFVFFRPPRV